MNRFSIITSFERGAAHAERPPGVEDLHFRRLHRHAEMDDLSGSVFAVMHGAGHQQVAGRARPR